MPVTEQERRAALGRLAAQEVVALTDAQWASDEDMKIVAAARCFTVFSEWCIQNRTTGMEVLDKIVDLLQKARLTIAFKSGSWFYDENNYNSYANMFQRGSSGASNDFKKRNNVETELLQYTGRSMQALPRGASKDQVLAAQDRIAQHGVYNTPNFQAAMRPKYAAVDFAKCLYGASSKYGKSFFVLKPHMAHNATFCHRDSFEIGNPQNMEDTHPYKTKTIPLKLASATYFSLERVVYFCELAMLKKLFEYATGQKALGSENTILLGIAYIEAHLHADLIFNRDVAELHLSSTDVQTGPVPHPRFNARWPNKKTVWDQSDQKRVRKHAAVFARKHNIKLVDIA